MKTAVVLAGGQTALARHLGITQGAISQWRAVPAVHVVPIETLIEGQVTRNQMRPDIFGPAPDSKGAAA